jgi:hypothetical protein
MRSTVLMSSALLLSALLPLASVSASTVEAAQTAAKKAQSSAPNANDSGGRLPARGRTPQQARS